MKWKMLSLFRPQEKHQVTNHGNSPKRNSNWDSERRSAVHFTNRATQRKRAQIQQARRCESKKAPVTATGSSVLPNNSISPALAGNLEGGKSVDDLPAEILLDIGDLLNRKDLLSLRTANSRLNEILTSVHFKTFKLIYQPLRRFSKDDLSGPYRFCSLHGYFDGTGAPCNATYSSWSQWICHPSECGFHSSAVAKTLEEPFDEKKSHWNNVSGRYDAVSAPLMHLVRTQPGSPLFTLATTFFLRFDKRWLDSNGEDSGGRFFRHFVDSGLQDVLAAMVGLRSVRVLAHFNTGGGNSCDWARHLFEKLGSSCSGRKLNLHITLIIETPFYWSEVVGLLDSLSSAPVSSLAISTPLSNHERLRFNGKVGEVFRSALAGLNVASARDFESSQNIDSIFKLGSTRLRCHIGPQQDAWIRKHDDQKSPFLDPYITT